MTVRNAQLTDLEAIKQIYAYAREQMKKNGNPSQWGDNRPSEDTIRADIRNFQSYVITRKTETCSEICGAFAFIIGEDPTYRIPEYGHWLNEAPYGTIHRLAAGDNAKGIFNTCLAWCLAQIPNIRIDTHRDNLIMRHLLEKNGFKKCGIIYLENNSPRLAYQKSPDV